MRTIAFWMNVSAHFDIRFRFLKFFALSLFHWNCTLLVSTGTQINGLLRENLCYYYTFIKMQSVFFLQRIGRLIFQWRQISHHHHWTSLFTGMSQRFHGLRSFHHNTNSWYFNFYSEENRHRSICCFFEIRKYCDQKHKREAKITPLNGSIEVANMLQTETRTKPTFPSWSIEGNAAHHQPLKIHFNSKS